MNAVELEVFRNILTSIAEEMGVALMRSAFSPNIKERRDFSCAIFDIHGEMVAQAAHIPVHLASTPMSVHAAMEAFDLSGDMHVVLNDPFFGGTHLPDITIVSPVTTPEGEVVFYVANRAHHADVGGISPGSLPLSTHIDEEGIRLAPTLWSDALEAAIAGSSRTPDERRGDLRAQIAANLRGRERLLQQWQKYATKLFDAVVALQNYSERFMRNVLSEIEDGRWTFEDFLDDDGFGNAPIPLRCAVTIENDRVIVDFRDVPLQVKGPLNVPRAVTVSAVMYVFRCLAPAQLPSNGGYMRCIDVLTEPGTILDARYPAPVAAGNMETSQRVTDVVMGALAQAAPERVPAASCGSMNNVVIGGIDSRRAGETPFAYYETLAGGSGAGSGFHGASAVHTHMTNTLNTPVEALEHAYPFRVSRYAIRRGSGGCGRYRGGDGIVRCYEFQSDATVTLMTERRTTKPYGLSGGGDAASGINGLLREGQQINLPAKCTIEVGNGDRICIETPGGGGFGSLLQSSEDS